MISLQGLRGTVSGSRLFALIALLVVFTSLTFSVHGRAETPGSLRGRVADPSGALVPGAALSLTAGMAAFHVQSGSDGLYAFKTVPAGSYTLEADAAGFAHFTQVDVVIVAGQTRELSIALAIATEQQNVEVTSQANGVSVSSDEWGTVSFPEGRQSRWATVNIERRFLWCLSCPRRTTRCRRAG